MGFSDFRLIFHILWVISLLFAWTSGTMHGIVPVKQFFPESESDLTKITWAHGVNSRAKLLEALNGPAMMLEADILMGRKEGSDEMIPIMAHPPAATSDLSFDDFLKEVSEAVIKQKKRKGIKLDFKDDSAVTPVLKVLKQKVKKYQQGFPIWINADILRGPVNATKKPLDAKEFIERVKKYLPNATLSIGWTTRFGYDDSKDSRAQAIKSGKYSKEDIKDMLRLLTDHEIDGDSTEITFPIRAGIAAQSVDEIMDLLGKTGKTTVTIWSDVDDPVDMDSLRNLINLAGNRRCYIDLPFPLETGPSGNRSTTPGPEFDQDHVHDEDCDHDTGNEVSGSSLTSVSLICLTSFFIAGLVILLI